MTFRTNLAASYASQIYVAAVAIGVTPFYLKALGAEAYGLVGFFTMLLAWFHLLDFGLSPAILRETARFRGGSVAAQPFRQTVRAIELLFLMLAVLSAVLTAVLAEPISTDWLSASGLSPSALRDSLWLMAGSIGLRFASVFYRALLTGFEQFAWLAGFNALMATLRAFAVLPALALWGGTPHVFFWAQLAVSVVELAWVARRAYRSLPSASQGPGLCLAPLRGVARFSATVAFTSGLTVAVTQADRLILSGLLTLQDYAYFNLAVQAAGAILMASGPLTAAMLPRLSTLVAGNADEGLRRIYALGIGLMSIGTLPLAMTLALYGRVVLWAWTGRDDVVDAASGVLALYAIGNAVQAHLSLPYALQFAHGKLRLHVIGSALLVVTLVPLQVLMTMKLGAVGAGASWLAMNVLYAVLWVPLTMRGVDPDTHKGWLPGMLRVAGACFAAAAVAYPLRDIALSGGSRLAATAFLAVVFAMSTVAGVIACAPLRGRIAARLRQVSAGSNRAADAGRDASGTMQPRVGFVGSMNAMPMAYALKFRRDGFDVRYVVESGRDNYLMRPEYQFRGEIAYPYPDWIVEIPWPNDMRHHATLPYSNRAVLEAMRDRDVIFLNDYGIALAPWMPKRAVCVALSSGADIDLWCQWGLAFRRAFSGRRKWAYPLRLPLELWRTRLQRQGLRRCRTVCYFPRGLNPTGDRLIEQLCSSEVSQRTIERYDMDFVTAGARRAPVLRRDLSTILVPVRFYMLPMPGNESEHKGNDLILRALARYRLRRPSVQIHLFDKGPKPDLELAHLLCRELGLDDCVTWHEPMPLAQLLDMYEQADVCIDQVGNHWMGAIGFHALYMGRPLIANARPEVFERLWGCTAPVLQATTEDEIVEHLIRCEDLGFRERVACEGHRFAVEHLDAEGVYQRMRSSIMRSCSDPHRGTVPP